MTGRAVTVKQCIWRLSGINPTRCHGHKLAGCGQLKSRHSSAVQHKKTSLRSDAAQVKSGAQIMDEIG